jgi:hypothetical protein
MDNEILNKYVGQVLGIANKFYSFLVDRDESSSYDNESKSTHFALSSAIEFWSRCIAIAGHEGNIGPIMPNLGNILHAIQVIPIKREDKVVDSNFSDIFEILLNEPIEKQLDFLKEYLHRVTKARKAIDKIKPINDEDKEDIKHLSNIIDETKETIQQIINIIELESELKGGSTASDEEAN